MRGGELHHGSPALEGSATGPGLSRTRFPGPAFQSTDIMVFATVRQLEPLTAGARYGQYEAPCRGLPLRRIEIPGRRRSTVRGLLLLPGLPQGLGFRKHSFHGLCGQRRTVQRANAPVLLEIRAWERGSAQLLPCLRRSRLRWRGRQVGKLHHLRWLPRRSVPLLPTVAIFTRDRPAWAPLPPGLTEYHTMPG
jgi:hypothetical protein